MAWLECKLPTVYDFTEIIIPTTLSAAVPNCNGLSFIRNNLPFTYFSRTNPLVGDAE